MKKSANRSTGLPMTISPKYIWIKGQHTKWGGYLAGIIPRPQKLKRASNFMKTRKKNSQK